MPRDSSTFPSAAAHEANRPAGTADSPLAQISAIEERLDAPTARGLAQAVTRAIRDGVVQPGDRLPPIRVLAVELMLSPTTVSSAWQLLTRSGSIIPDGRRGTKVAERADTAGSRYRRALRHHSSAELDLSTGIPDPDLLPDLGPALGTLPTAGTPASYLEPPVLPELREVILSDWPYAAEDLMILDGAMDALDLIVSSRLGAGDLVVVESPGFPPLLDLLEARRISMIGVPVDESGMTVDGLDAALRRSPAAVILQPRAQNPTGVSMTQTRARSLAKLLGSTETLVVEDDSAGHVGAAGPISLGRHLPDRTLHIRSFSKSHGPDLRLAALSGTTDLLAPIRGARAVGQGWSSRLLQRLLLALLTDPGAQRQVERARAEYARRRDAVTRRLHERGIAVGGTDGLNIWLPVADEAAAVLRLAGDGIAVTPGSPFMLEPSAGPQGHIRVTTGLIREDHERIADLLADAATTGAWTAQHR